MVPSLAWALDPRDLLTLRGARSNGVSQDLAAVGSYRRFLVLD